MMCGERETTKKKNRDAVASTRSTRWEPRPEGTTIYKVKNKILLITKVTVLNNKEKKAAVFAEKRLDGSVMNDLRNELDEKWDA